MSLKQEKDENQHREPAREIAESEKDGRTDRRTDSMIMPDLRRHQRPPSQAAQPQEAHVPLHQPARLAMPGTYRGKKEGERRNLNESETGPSA
jgi:hypothetical protein